MGALPGVGRCCKLEVAHAAGYGCAALPVVVMQPDESVHVGLTPQPSTESIAPLGEWCQLLCCRGQACAASMIDGRQHYLVGAHPRRSAEAAYLVCHGCCSWGMTGSQHLAMER